MFLYEDLLAIPTKPSPSQVDLESLEHEKSLQDAITIQGAESRLSQSHPDILPQPLGDAHQYLVSGDVQPHHRVLAQAQAITARLEDMRRLALKSADTEGVAGPSKISVPISVLSVKECEALVRACVSTTLFSNAAKFLIPIYRRERKMGPAHC